MSFFYQDPHEKKLPPEDIRLKSVQATPSTSAGRVKIRLELTPFQQRPNIDVSITDPTGKVVAHTTIIETMLSVLDFFMHIREAQTEVDYQVDTRVYYQKMPQATKEPMDIELPEPIVVDQKLTKILFPRLPE